VTKAERTAARLLEVALDLFDRDGYDGTTVARIAAAAGVSEMTFFRHFGSKEALLLDDPYDPMIAAAVAAQPRDLPPLIRAAAGIRASWARIPETAESVRRRLRLAADPALRGAVTRNTLETERVVAAQLVADGADPAAARIAAAALLAALMAALLDWAAGDDESTMGTAIERALDVLEGGS
jgi:AcrR family transcriptional regulator